MLGTRFFDHPKSPSTHVPLRTCVGCRQRMPASVLLRTTLVRRGDSEILVVDFQRKLDGRGAWVCPSPACVLTAGRRKAFARALRQPGSVPIATVLEDVTAYVKNNPTMGKDVHSINDMDEHS